MVIFLTNEAIKSISGPVMECIELLVGVHTCSSNTYIPVWCVLFITVIS